MRFIFQHFDQHPMRLIASNSIVFAFISVLQKASWDLIITRTIGVLTIGISLVTLYRKLFSKRHQKLIMRDILIIDDDEEDLMLYSRAFTRANCKVTTRSRFEGAMETLQGARKIDLVLLDVKIDNHKVWEMYRAIQTERPTLPVVIYSGSAVDQDTLDKILHVGPTMIALKNADFDGFVRMVIDYLRLGQAK